MTLPRILLSLSIAFLAACATQHSLPPPPPYVQTLQSMGVAPETMQRIEAARVLTFQDVMNLVSKGVPGDKIVAYMKATRAPYDFSTVQVNELTAAGADSTLVNYVGRDAGDLMIDAENEGQQQRILADARWQKMVETDPYFTDMEFWGPPPFGFGWPAIWY